MVHVDDGQGVQAGDGNFQVNIFHGGQRPDAGVPVPGDGIPGDGQLIRSSLDVTLWGGPECGKSTYLGALNIAAGLASPRWTFKGRDSGSTEMLIRLTADMVGRGEFPPPTLGINDARFVMSGSLDDGAGPVPAEFELSVVDPGGEHYRQKDMWSDAKLITRLRQSNGIVYFFDPVLEAEWHSASELFHATAARLEEQERLSGGRRLPHRVAVCVAKCDDPEVFSFAADNGYLAVDASDPHGIPRVPEDRAREFFDVLYRKSNPGGGSLLSHTIQRYFHPDRIRYFAISSLGFHLGESGRFDAADYYNLIPTMDGRRWLTMARGDFRPVGVLEPLLWLAAPDVHPGAVRRRNTSRVPWSPPREAASAPLRAAAGPRGARAARPGHLICITELAGADYDGARLDRVLQLASVAFEASSDLRVSLVTYGPHGVSGRLREWPATVVTWATTGGDLPRLAARLSQRPPKNRQYSLAAQVECALAEVASRLSGTEGPVALVTAGSRPAFPQRMTPGSRTLPCPRRTDWRTVLAELRSRGGVFGAIHDHAYDYDDAGQPLDADDEIWAQLGADANAVTTKIDVHRFAAALGLLPQRQEMPYPPDWRQYGEHPDGSDAADAWPDLQDRSNQLKDDSWWSAGRRYSNNDL